MADITVVPASVLGSASANGSTANAGEAILQGQACYLKDADKKFWLADNNAAAAEAATVKGVSLNAASPNQPVKVQSSGELTAGAVLVVGQIYCLSATPGGICPYADLLTGNRVSILGVAKTAAILTLTILNSGIAKP